MTQVGRVAGASTTRSPTSSNGSSSSSNSTGMVPNATGSPRRDSGCDTAPTMPALPTPTPDEGFLESGVDALEGGDRVLRPGTARAALRHRVFRRVFIGAF